jgi:predicted neuraminidase
MNDPRKCMLWLFMAFLLPRSYSQIIHSEFIFQKAPFQSCHASTLVELRSGGFMAAWFGGSREGAPDVAIWYSLKNDSIWSEPKIVAKEHETPCYNPVLFYGADQKLWLYYKYGSHPSMWSAARMVSLDDGKTWSAKEYLPAGIYGPIRTAPLVMPQGLILFGTSVESYRRWAVWIERSSDYGKTWNKMGPIVPAQKPKTSIDSADKGNNDWEYTHGIIQPSLVWMGGRHIRLYARATQSIGYIVYSDSYDLGLHWSPTKTLELPNPNSGIDAIRLSSGKIIMAYNHHSTDRSPLNLAISENGVKFSPWYEIESEPDQEFSYPYLIQARDGKIHLLYTWKREKIKHITIKP